MLTDSRVKCLFIFCQSEAFENAWCTAHECQNRYCNKITLSIDINGQKLDTEYGYCHQHYETYTNKLADRYLAGFCLFYRECINILLSYNDMDLYLLGT